MNPFLILSPIGMTAVAALSVAYWKASKGLSFRYFLFGGLVWVLAVTPKFVLDLTITPTINEQVSALWGIPGLMVVLGLYVGLRTGILECGFTYLAFSKTRLRNASLDEAVAFGIGFGALEAVLVAVSALASILVFTFNPSLIQLLPEEARQAVEAGLNMPTWVVFAPIMERALVILIHVFSTLMIYVSVRKRDLKVLSLAILYKTAVDAPIPYLHLLFNPTVSPQGTYLVEVWPAVLGLIALLGIKHVRNHF